MTDVTNEQMEAWLTRQPWGNPDLPFVNRIRELLRQPPPSQTAREIASDIGYELRHGEGFDPNWIERKIQSAIDAAVATEHAAGLAYAAGKVKVASDAAVREHNEACAKLSENIPNHCSHEVNCHGAGAIGAIVRYRDAIRSLLPTKAKQEDET